MHVCLLSVCEKYLVTLLYLVDKAIFAGWHARINLLQNESTASDLIILEDN